MRIIPHAVGGFTCLKWPQLVRLSVPVGEDLSPGSAVEDGDLLPCKAYADLQDISIKRCDSATVRALQEAHRFKPSIIRL